MDIIPYIDLNIEIHTEGSFTGIRIYRDGTLEAEITANGVVGYASDNVRKHWSNIKSRLNLWNRFDVRKKMYTFYFHGGMEVYCSPAEGNKTYAYVVSRTDKEVYFVLDLEDMSVVERNDIDSLVIEIISDELRSRVSTMVQNRPKHIMEVELC